MKNSPEIATFKYVSALGTLQKLRSVPRLKLDN